MATLQQIAQTYADSVNKPFDDMFIERIKFSIKYWRATLIRREFERTAADRTLKQSFLKSVEDPHPTDDCFIQGCNVKVVKDVPRPINIKGNPEFTYVGDRDRLTPPFQPSTSTEIRLWKKTPFHPGLRNYRYVNNDVYLYGSETQKHILFEGYMEDPYKAMEECLASNECIDEAVDDFFISSHMLEAIYRGLANGTMRMITEQQEVLENK